MYKILICIFLLMGCNRSRSINFNEKLPYDNQIEFKKVFEKQFELDSLSFSGSSYNEILELDGRRVLTFLNRKTNSIYVYDFDTEEFLNSIQFEIKGDNGVGKLDGYHIVNLDSVFTYSYAQKKLCLVNSLGEDFDCYSVIDPKGEAMLPQVHSTRPIIKKGDVLYLNSWGSNREYRKNDSYEFNKFLSINIKTNEKTYFLTYPETYHLGVWGVQFHQFFHSYNESRKELVISFPNDHYIYTFNLDNSEIQKYYAGSDKIDKIEPLSLENKKISIPIMEEVSKQNSQSWYHSIIYDKYRDLYFRVVYLALDEMFDGSFDTGKPILNSQAIIVLDENMKKVGEIILPKKQYFTPTMFITKEGLCIEKVNFENEDLLLYDVFDVIKESRQ